MSHLDTRHVVAGRIVCEDSAFLDQIEQALPDEDDVALGNEFDKTREPETDEDGNETGNEVLSARMTFAPDGKEVLDDDGNVIDTIDPEQASSDLFEKVANSDLANQAQNWELRHYRSPEGGVTADDVRAYYERNPGDRPTDEDGEPYVPSLWDPDHHTFDETSV